MCSYQVFARRVSVVKEQVFLKTQMCLLLLFQERQ